MSCIVLWFPGLVLGILAFEIALTVAFFSWPFVLIAWLVRGRSYVLLTDDQLVFYSSRTGNIGAVARGSPLWQTNAAHYVTAETYLHDALGKICGLWRVNLSAQWIHNHGLNTQPGAIKRKELWKELARLHEGS
jgi:hypothetical protein